jgi:phosphoribosyl 1,2-cyclic phosphate phosphodiesterase
MSLTFTILGCGSSGGVPRIGGDWGACNPRNAKNRRRRCSMLIEQSSDDARTKVLVDTSPDMREQMLTTNVASLDGVWYTHEHADHTHGIDELRAFFLRQRERIHIWADAPTSAMLETRFAYCFKTPPGGAYPPILEKHLIEPGRIMETEGPGGAIKCLPFTVHHGDIEAIGFRVASVAYTPDLNGIPDASLPALEHLDVWIIDALRQTPHPTHFSLSEALHWIDQLKPKRAILTNMHLDMDYDELRKSLPGNVEPAFDGLSFTIKSYKDLVPL